MLCKTKSLTGTKLARTSPRTNADIATRSTAMPPFRATLGAISVTLIKPTDQVRPAPRQSAHGLASSLRGCSRQKYHQGQQTAVAQFADVTVKHTHGVSDTRGVVSSTRRSVHRTTTKRVESQRTVVPCGLRSRVVSKTAAEFPSSHAAQQPASRYTPSPPYKLAEWPAKSLTHYPYGASVAAPPDTRVVLSYLRQVIGISADPHLKPRRRETRLGCPSCLDCRISQCSQPTFVPPRVEFSGEITLDSLKDLKIGDSVTPEHSSTLQAVV
ncbi:hypothetical protein Bbelb_062160 [Branchiostoma belcheri]|nr:hypothetical protein Bbelb_062160 [Branchiostoma belcheri]